MREDRSLPIQRLEGILQTMILKLKRQALLSASCKCPWGSSYSYEGRLSIVSKECKQTHFLRNSATVLLRVKSQQTGPAWRIPRQIGAPHFINTHAPFLDPGQWSPNINSYHKLQQLHHHPWDCTYLAQAAGCWLEVESELAGTWL